MKRRWLRIGLIGLAILLISLLFAPRLAGTGFVRRHVEEALREETGLDISIESIDAGWWSGLEVRGIRMRTREGEFAGAELVTLERATLDNGIFSLLGGSDLLALEVEGLVVTLEQRAGGRTSADKLLRRWLPLIAQPALPQHDGVIQPPTAKPPRAPIPPFRVVLRNCALRLQRLPYLAPSSRVDPFKGDIPIRAMHAGRLDYALDVNLIEFELNGSTMALLVNSTIRHPNGTGLLNANLKMEGEEIEGQFDVQGFELEVLEGLFPGRLNGIVSISAKGNYSPKLSYGEWAVEVHNLRVGDIEEKWVRGGMDIAANDEHLRLEDISLTSASGRVLAEGRLDFALLDSLRPSGSVSGHIPLAPLYRLASKRTLPDDARARFELFTDLRDDGGTASGSINIDNFTAPDRENDITLRFAAHAERTTTIVTIDDLDLRAPFARVDLAGSIDLSKHWAVDLSGDAQADLEKLRDIAADFVPSLADAPIAGNVELTIKRARRSPNGDIEYAGKSRIANLAVGDATMERLLVSVDARVHDDFDQLEIRNASVEGITLSGSVSGLRAAHGFPLGIVTVAGPISVSRELLERFGVDVFRACDGELQLDVSVRSTGTELLGSGTAQVKQLNIDLPGFRWKDPSADVEIEARFDGSELTSNVRVVGQSLTAHTTQLSFDAAKNLFRVGLDVDLPDPSQLRDQYIPEDWIWEGALKCNAYYEWRDGAHLGRATVKAKAARFLAGDIGIENEEVHLLATAHTDGDEWSFFPTSVTLPQRELKATSNRFDLRGYILEADLDIDANLDLLSDWVPVLEGRGIVAIEGRRIEIDGAKITAPQIVIRSASGITVNGEGVFDDALRVQLKSTGTDIETILAFVPGVSGSGKYDIEVKAEIPTGGPIKRFAVVADVLADELVIADTTMKGDRLRLDAKFGLHGGDLDDLRLEAEYTADTVERDGMVATKVSFRSDGRGSLRRERGPGHRLDFRAHASRVKIGETEIIGSRLVGRAVLVQQDLTAPYAVEVQSTLSIDKILGKKVSVKDATGKVGLEHHVLRIREIVASLQDGTVRGWAAADFNPAEFAWAVDLELKKAQLDRGFTDPLSFVIPILRLTGTDTGAKGRVAIKAQLQAEGTSGAAIKRTLRGRGKVTLDEAEVQGSLLLPLLSLRVGRLLLNKPYRIPDGTVNWTIQDQVVRTEPFVINGRPFAIKLGGTVTLDGEMDYVVHPGILLLPLRAKGPWGNVSVLPAPGELLPDWPAKK